MANLYTQVFQLVKRVIGNSNNLNSNGQSGNYKTSFDILPTNTSTGLNTGVRDIEASVTKINEIINDIPSKILQGLDVRIYQSNWILITGGITSTSTGLHRYDFKEVLNNLDVYTKVQVDTSTIGTKYVVISHEHPDIIYIKPDLDVTTDLLLAKIIIHVKNAPIFDDANATYTNNYIVSGKDIAVDTEFAIDDAAREIFTDLLTKILAENIQGTIKLSEGLQITNQDGSIQMDSNTIKIYQDQVKYAEFNRNGVYFYNSTGQILANYTKDGATIGQISIKPNSIESKNFQTGNSGFKLSDNGNAEFNDVTVRGHIDARDGTIGKWDIFPDRLVRNVTVSGAGMSPKDYPFYAGSNYANRATAPFRVSKAGILYATGAVISGTIVSHYISAVSGTVGGWHISSNKLSGGVMTLYSSGVIHTPYFNVSNTGKISATGGKIGGWNIQSGKLSGGSTVLYASGVIHTPYFNVSNTGQISATSGRFAGKITASSGAIGGWSISSGQISGGVMRLYSSGVIHSTNFNVSNTGVLSATAGRFAGKITASSGTIGGWSISANTLSSSNGKIKLDSLTNSGTISVGNTASAYIQIKGNEGGLAVIKSSNFSNSNTNPKGFKFSSDGTIHAVDGVFKGKLEGNIFVKNSVNVAGGDLVLAISTHITQQISSTLTTFNIESGVFFVNDLVRISNSSEIMKVTTVSGLSLTCTRGYKGTTPLTYNSKSVIYQIGVASQNNKGYIELQGATQIIRIHNTNDLASAVVSTEVVNIGLLNNGVHAGKYGLKSSVVELSGNITATSGSIGGWRVTNGILSGGNTRLYSSGVIHTPYFNISNTGQISATSANITGRITASSGVIGKWYIRDNVIQSTPTTIVTGIVTASAIIVANPVFAVNDLLMQSGSTEIMKVISLSGSIIKVTRGYKGTTVPSINYSSSSNKMSMYDSAGSADTPPYTFSNVTSTWGYVYYYNNQYHKLCMKINTFDTTKNYASGILNIYGWMVGTTLNFHANTSHFTDATDGYATFDPTPFATFTKSVSFGEVNFSVNIPASILNSWRTNNYGVTLTMPSGRLETHCPSDSFTVYLTPSTQLYKIGEAGVTNKGYIELQGTTQDIVIHNTDDTGGTVVRTNPVQLGYLTSGVHSGKFGLNAKVGEIGGWSIGTAVLSSINGRIRLDSLTNSGTITVGNVASAHIQIKGNDSGVATIKSSNYSSSVLQPKGFKLSSTGVLNAIDGTFKGILDSTVGTHINTQNNKQIYTTSTHLGNWISSTVTTFTLESAVFSVNDLVSVSNSTEVLKITTTSGTSVSTTRSYESMYALNDVTYPYSVATVYSYSNEVHYWYHSIKFTTLSSATSIPYGRLKVYPGLTGVYDASKLYSITIYPNTDNSNSGSPNFTSGVTVTVSNLISSSIVNIEIPPSWISGWINVNNYGLTIRGLYRGTYVGGHPNSGPMNPELVVRNRIYPDYSSKSVIYKVGLASNSGTPYFEIYGNSPHLYLQKTIDNGTNVLTNPIIEFGKIDTGIYANRYGLVCDAIQCNTLTLNSNMTIFRNPSTPPTTATSVGIKGHIEWDSGFIYVCIDTDTWKRATLNTW